ncbi:MAG: 4-hydroxy-tetrahydrodipicolinate synthase [Candidatus Nitrospinota bacterium M3_3B_026]
MFSGSFVAIVTPFKDGKIDEKAFADLIDWQIESGANGIVACGTTGESPTLTHDEHNRVIDLCVEAAAGRVPVIAGTGSNSTAEAIALTRHAAAAGAAGALLISPYYNKPTQEGIYQHYKAVANAVDIPQIIYNIPGRTASLVSVDTIARLASHKNIVGIKDAVGDLSYTAELIERTGSGFVVLSGDDAATFPMMAIGGKGVISSTANVVPDRMAALARAAMEGDWATARGIHYELLGLMKAMFIETNPIPVKTALAMMGKVEEEFRLPLCPMSQMNREKLKNVMNKAGLLEGAPDEA